MPTPVMPSAPATKTTKGPKAAAGVHPAALMSGTVVRQVAALAKQRQATMPPGTKFGAALQAEITYLRANKMLDSVIRPTAEDSLAYSAGATPDNLRTFESGLDASAADFIAGRHIPYMRTYSEGKGKGNEKMPLMFTITERAAQMLKPFGLTPEELPMLAANSEARTAALKKVDQIQAVISSRVASLAPDITKMLRAMRAVGPGQLPPWNSISLATRRAAGSPEVAAYEQAVLDVQADYGPILTFSASSGGSTNFAMKRSEEALSKAFNPQQMEAAASQLMQAAHNAERGLNQSANALDARLTVPGLGPVGEGGAAPSSAAPTRYVAQNGTVITQENVTQYGAAHHMTEEQVIAHFGLAPVPGKP